MKNLILKFKNKKLVNLYSSLLAIFGGLLLGLLIMLIFKPVYAFQGFMTLLTAGFGQGTKSLGNVLYFATPILLTGLSVGFSFKTGLFNIGAAGQLLVGGYVSILIAIKLSFLGPVVWVIALIGAVLAGAIWSLIPGLLKAHKGVHEVVSTIMMNYVGLFLVNFLIKKTIYYQIDNNTLPVPPNGVIPKLGLDVIFRGSNIQGGFIIAILAAIVIYIILSKTVLGFELTGVGLNEDASKYAGINSKKRIIQSMMISGALAGAAGAAMYLSDSRTFINVVEVLPAQGFMGISVALLANSNPVGIIGSAIFFGYLTVGGARLQVFGLSPELVDIIIGTIVYFSSLAIIFKNIVFKIIKDKKEGEK